MIYTQYEDTVFDSWEDLELAQMFLNTLAVLKIFNYWDHYHELPM